MSDSYYPAHASLPLDELEIWDNDDRPAVEQLREWFREAGAGWENVACIECELGRPCLKSPPCSFESARAGREQEEAGHG